MAKPIMSLEQFSALDAWVEAAAELAGLKVAKGVPHAPVITKVYQKRARAMFLLTGAKAPAAAADDDGSDLA